MHQLISRRTLLRHAGLGAGAAMIAAALPHGARAAEPQKLDVKDQAAVALAYVENAATVDPKKQPTYSPGSNCANCLQLQGKDGDAYRPCALFPGKLVATAGWCTGWTAEM